MRKFLFFIVLIGVIGGGGYYLYDKNVKSKLSVEELVPVDAAFFYTTSNIIEDWEAFKSSFFGAQLLTFDAVSNSEKEIASILKVMGVDELPISLSVHKTGKSDFDLIYYVRKSSSSALQGLIRVFAKKEAWISESRRLDGIEITEYRQGKDRLVSFCQKADWFIISKSPYLLEEVIKNKSTPTWKGEDKKWVLFPNKFKDFTKIFLEEYPQEELVDFGSDPVRFELDFFEKGVALNGVVQLSGEQKAEESKTVSISRNIVPMDISQLILKNEKQQLKGKNGKVLTVTVNAGDITSQTPKDTLFIESEEFPIFEVPLADGNTKGVAFAYQGHMVSARSISDLESVCTALVQENVWGKSVKVNRFLENCNGEVNEGLYINFSAYVDVLEQRLNEEYQTLFERNKAKFGFLNFISLEMLSDANNRIYEGFVSVSINTNPVPVTTENELEDTKEDLMYEHETAIMSQPFVVKNHNTGEREILFQDDSLQLCLLTTAGNLLWKRAFKFPILDKIYQVDVFRNGKLQYLFVTKEALYVVDRNGEDVEGFPMAFESPVESLSLFDYERNRNYRFVTALENGDIYFIDGKGNKLEPWNPKKINMNIKSDIVHFSKGGKDYIVFLTSDNKLHGFNRRGEYYNGFPVDVGMKDILGMSIAKEGAANGGVIKVINSDGKLKGVNTNGEIVSNTTIKLEAQESLELVLGNERELYALDNGLEKYIMDRDGTSLFVDDQRASIIQFYNFSGSNDIVVCCDSTYSTIYSLKGSRVAKFPSSNKISCIYSSAREELSIYKVSDNRVSTIVVDY